MFESFSFASPRRTPPTEWLLSRIAGRDRAAAILGDLLEISATRGRLWFWTAYARTLISLGWRTPIAFLCAIVSMRFVFGRVIWLLFEPRTPHLMDAGLFGEHNSHVTLVVANLLLVTASFLRFALPFVFIRYGLRDRLTQLAGALFIIIMPVYSFRPRVVDLSGVVAALAIVAALLSPLWRKPMIVLAATCVTTLTAVAACLYISLLTIYPEILPLHNVPPGLSGWLTNAFFPVIAAVVCLGLHRRLLAEPPAANSMLA